MGIGRRALLYLTRKKGRSFLLFLIFLLLACFILAGKVLVRNSQSQIDLLTQNLGASFVLKIDENNPNYQETRTGNGYSYIAYAGPEITEGMLADILKIEGVSDYSVDLEIFAWTDLKLKPGQWAVSSESEYITQEEVDLRTQVIRAYICSNGG